MAGSMGVRGLVVGFVLTAAALPGVAMAQMPSASRNGFQPQFQPKEKSAKREAPPPALPGAVPVPGEDTTKGVPVDLAPTEALFDSINRGDITEARDALARGADLQAQNVLGMTPIALSVDLARNDITFLLLSYRGSGGSAPPQSAAIKSADAGKPDRPLRPGAKREVAAAVQVPFHRIPRPTPNAAQASNVAIAHPTTTASGTPGIPVPQAGFLGFGNSVQN